MRKTVLVTFVVALAVAMTAVATTAVGQTDLRAHPGYFPIDELGLMESEMVQVDINLSGSLLKMVSAATKNEDPELSEMMGNLKGIRVLVGEAGDLDVTAQFVDDAVRDLEGRGWQSIVRVREGDERAHILVMEEGEMIHGMTIIAFEEGDELALINIVGTIDPAQMGRLLGSIDGVEGIDLDEHFR